MSYEVSVNGGQWSAADSSSQHRFTGLTSGTTYTLAVRTRTTAGWSNPETVSATLGGNPAPQLVVRPISWNPPATADYQTVQVEATGQWQATSSHPSWLSVSPASGTGNGSFTVSVTPNPTIFVRTGIITITYGTTEFPFAVNQAAALL